MFILTVFQGGSQSAGPAAMLISMSSYHQVDEDYPTDFFFTVHFHSELISHT